MAYVWGLWKETVNIERIVNSGYVLCWAAKWLDRPAIAFNSIHRSPPRRMMRELHRFLNEADVVVTYNGNTFDLPTVNKEFVQFGMKPPAPYKEVDLLAVVRRTFRFPSNKLDYVCKALGLGGKIRHSGFDLWVRCMAKDSAAWKEMEQYNRRDVTILESLYQRVLPWIEKHPNAGAYEDDAGCPKCGGQRFQRRGEHITTTLRYARFQCLGCGGWFRKILREKGLRANYQSIIGG